MLAQNKYQKNEVLTIKLVSGEEVIGYFVQDTASELTLRKPVVPVPTNEGSLALAPYIMSSDYLREANGEVTFNKSAVITILPTSKQFKDGYTKQVSGLDFSSSPPTTGLITT